jgi:hypothetical protein
MDQTISKPTDLLACAGLLYAGLLFMRFLTDGSLSRNYGCYIGIAVMIPVAFRYMYLSCIWVIPVVLLWLGYRNKDKRLSTGGVYTLLLAAALSVAGFLAQKSIVGSAAYIVQTEKGFFPENLLMLYPFIADAFFDINFIQQQISGISGLPYIFLYECLKLINLVMLGILLVKFVTHHKQRWYL